MHLFTAGPSSLSPRLIPFLTSPILHHRSKEFTKIFETCHDELLRICSMQEVFFLCSSGSGAMESAISTFSPKHLLILENGKFSARWGEIAQSFGIVTTILHCSWDNSHKAKQVLEILTKNPSIDGVCLCGVESSGGVREEYEEIAKVAKEFNPSLLVFVDAIALFGGEKINTTHIDVLVCSSQKILGLPVGLSMVFVGSYAFTLMQERKPKSFYLALQNYMHDPIAFSLPSHLFLALEFVLKNINFESNYALIKKRFEITKSILEDKGISLYAKTPAYSIIAFNDPQSHIKNTLAQKNILISSGQSHLKNEVSRIGNFGGFQEYERLLEGLERITPQP